MASTRTHGAKATPRTGLDDKVSVFGYLCLGLNVCCFSALLVADPWTFHALSREDYWVENLTAVWFLLAGLLLSVGRGSPARIPETASGGLRPEAMSREYLFLLCPLSASRS